MKESPILPGLYADLVITDMDRHMEAVYAGGEKAGYGTTVRNEKQGTFYK